MNRFITDIKVDIKTTFNNEEFEKEKKIIKQEFEDKRSVLMEKLNKKSSEYGFQVKSSQNGIYMMPIMNGKAIAEDEFDKFADNLRKCNVQYVHQVKEHSWGQRVVRFYDPDKHIIEVGENMKIVCKRFLNSGMTPEQVAERMDVPMKFVNACMR